MDNCPDMSGTDKRDEIRKITFIGLFANIFLSVIKFVVGILGNSHAIVADSLHSFSDTCSDFLIIFGLKYWTAPPDDSHPYGHFKIESFVTITIGLSLIFMACCIGYNGIVSLLNGNDTIRLKWIATVVPFISIVVKEILFRATYSTGVRINSSSLKANAWHHRTDSLSSIPVLIAVIASLINPGLVFLDKVSAVIVAVFIIKVGLDILFTSIRELIDTGLSEDSIRDIKKSIISLKGVKGIHKLRTRKISGYIYMDLHLEVDGKISVTEGHDISGKVEQTLMANNPGIIDIMIHLEPDGDTDLRG